MSRLYLLEFRLFSIFPKLVSIQNNLKLQARFDIFIELSDKSKSSQAENIYRFKASKSDFCYQTTLELYKPVLVLSAPCW